MQDKDWQASNRLNGVILLLGALIAYGSFYPFDFAWHSLSLDELGRFFVAVDRRTTLGDILGNIVLFLPYGFVAVFAAERQARPRTHLAVLVGGGLALAVLIQLVQLFLKSRIPAIGDALWNALGLGLGLAGGWVGQRLLHRHRQFRNYSRLRFSLPVLLVALFVLGQWFPFVPTLDWQQVKDNVKPLLKAPVWNAQEFSFKLGAWLAALYFYARTWPRLPLVFRPWGLVLAVLSLSIFTKANSLTASEAAAAGLAALLLPLLMRGRRGLLVLALLFLCHGYGSLTPLALAEPLNPVSWIPFTGFLKGSIWANSRELLDKSFVYGAMLMLLAEAGVGWRPAALVVGFWVGLVEFGQIGVAGRHPELTEPILVVLMAFGMSHVQSSFLHASGGAAAAVRSSGPERRLLAQRGLAWRWRPEGLRAGLFWALGLSLLAALLLDTLAGSPSAPYNLRELFAGGFFAQWLFVLAAGWIGFGAGLASLRLDGREPPWLRLPLYALGCGLVLFLLLNEAVTGESLHDLVGVPVWQRALAGGAWGEGFAAWAGGLPADALGGLERGLRFLALVLPLFLCLLLMLEIGRRRAGELAGLALACAPWFWAAQWLSFGRAATDNLAELVAPDAALGLGGGVYLYGLLVLLSGLAVWLSRLQPRALGGWLVPALAVAFSLPLGWWLVNLALVSGFVKYGGTAYSGVDFLLGPDRSRKLAPEVLFARWSALQAVAELGLAFSLRLALGLVRRPQTELV